MMKFQTPKQTLTDFYSRKTQVWASVLGDMALVMIPIVTKLIEDAPNLTDAQKYWWSGVCTITGIAAKFILKLFKENETVD